MSQTKQGGKQRGFVSLDECIKNAIMDTGETMHVYERYKKWGLDTYKSFNFDLDAVVKTVVLSLTAWKAVTLPSDYVDYVMIGVEFDRQIRLFTNDRRISLHLPENVPPDGEPAVVTGSNQLPDPTDITRYFFYNLDGRWMDEGKLYGLAAKTNGVGEFKMNKERGEIQFNIALNSSTPIYLEYISTGIDPTEQICVNVYAGKLIELGIHRWRHHFSRSSSIAEKQLAEKAYYQEYNMVQNRLCPLRAEDVMEVMRDAYRLIQTV